MNYLNADLYLTALCGALLGQVVGVLPGFGPVLLATVLVQATFIPPEIAINLIIGAYVGAQFSSSTPAILLGIPGEVSSAITAEIGPRLARAGHAYDAILIASKASLVGTCMALTILLVFEFFSIRLSAIFSDLEILALVCCGGVLLVLGARRPKSGLLILAVGVVAGLLGRSPVTGDLRFNLEVPTLINGLEPIAFMLGLITIPEAIRMWTKGWSSRFAEDTRLVAPFRRRKWALGAAMPMGAFFGSIFGAIPGLGPTAATPLAVAIYGENRNRATIDPLHHDAKVVACAEAANNSAAISSLILLFALGLPTNTVTAIISSYADQYGVPWHSQSGASLPHSIMISLAYAAVILYFLNGRLALHSLHIFRLSPRVVSAGCLAICSFTVLSMEAKILAIVSLLAGALGALFSAKLRVPATLCVVGFVAAPIVEQRFIRLWTMWQAGALLEYGAGRAIISTILVSVTAIVILFFRRGHAKEAIGD